LLELESGSNDPMAYFLTVGVIYLMSEPDASIISLVPKFFKGMALGGIAGYAFGRAMTWIINQIKLDIDGLYPVLILSMVFFTFSFTDFIGGNGFLAVYIAAVILGNSSFLHKKSLIRFYDGQAWLMQIVMFLTLGLVVYPHEIVPLVGKGVLIALFLIFIARPVAVMISLVFFRELNIRKKLFLSWVGLRGAVPIIFATYPMLAGVSVAKDIFNLVFFISVSSVLLQGTTLARVAKWLHVSVPEKIKRKFPLDIETKENFTSELIELDIPPTSSAIGKAVMNLELPKKALIVLIHRDGKYITASGDTEIMPQDHLLVMADDKDSVARVFEAFDMKPTSH
jgi:cell volume regulation protein A